MSVAAVLATANHHSFSNVETAYGAPRSQTPATRLRRVGPQLLVEVAGTLVRDRRAGNDVKMPSLDVHALQMIEELGPRALRWVCQVVVHVPPGCGAASFHFGDSRGDACSEGVCHWWGQSCALFETCTAASLP